MKTPVLTIQVFRKKRGRRYIGILHVPGAGSYDGTWVKSVTADTGVDAVQKLVDDIRGRAYPSRVGRRPDAVALAKSLVEE